TRRIPPVGWRRRRTTSTLATSPTGRRSWAHVNGEASRGPPTITRSRTAGDGITAGHPLAVAQSLDFEPFLAAPVLFGWEVVDGDGGPEILDATPYGRKR